eukprot:gene12597-biopygen4193
MNPATMRSSGGKAGGKAAGGGTALAAKMPVAAQLAAKLAAKMPVAAKLPGGGKVWRQNLAAWRQSWDREPPATKLSRTRSASVQFSQFSSVQS